MGAGEEGAIELVTEYRPDAYPITPHGRNDYALLQIREIGKER